MINDNQIEVGPNDGWRAELCRGVDRHELYLVHRYNSAETERVLLYSYDTAAETSPLMPLFYVAQALARAVNCGVSASWLAEWARSWSGSISLRFPDGYKLLDTVEQSTRQHLFETPTGVRVVTEDEWAETLDPVELLGRLPGELLAYDDPFEAA